MEQRLEAELNATMAEFKPEKDVGLLETQKQNNIFARSFKKLSQQTMRSTQNKTISTIKGTGQCNDGTEFG